MQIALLALLTVVSMFAPVQVAATSKLNGAVQSPPFAVLIAFVMGTAGLAVVAASGVFGRAHTGTMFHAPWWAWTGGLITATLLTVQVIALPRVGAGSTVALCVAGQLVAALVVDHFGWLGVERAPVNSWRIGGLVLLVAGTVLLQKK